MQTGVEATPSLIVFLGPILALAIIAAFSDAPGDGMRENRRPWFDGHMGLWAGVFALCVVGVLEALELISASVFLASCRIIVIVTILASVVLWARSAPEHEEQSDAPLGDSREPAA